MGSKPKDIDFSSKFLAHPSSETGSEPKKFGGAKVGWTYSVQASGHPVLNRVVLTYLLIYVW